MMEIIQFYRSFSSGLVVQCVAVAWILLLSGTVNAAKSQEQASAYTLIAGQPVAREMRGGEQHTYQVTLSAGQYARMVVQQKGIDVVLALLGVDGRPLLEVDNNLSGTRGMEVVSLVAEVSVTGGQELLAVAAAPSIITLESSIVVKHGAGAAVG